MKKPNLNKLPDHTKQLNNIKVLVKKAFDRYTEDVKDNRVTPLKKKMYKYIFESYLYDVADLSLTRNEIRDELQLYYNKVYTEGSALGNKLFYDEYFSLHTQYNKVKKQIWRAIFKIDFICKKDKEKNVINPNMLF